MSKVQTFTKEIIAGNLFAEIKVAPRLLHNFEWSNVTEKIYTYSLEALIYDGQGRILATDDSNDNIEIKKVYVYKDGTIKVDERYTLEKIADRHITIMKDSFKHIEQFPDYIDYSRDLYDSCLDREDIEYNEGLYLRYRTLYKMIKERNLLVA